MAISPLLRVLAAAAVLFLSTPAWSAGQAPPSPVTSSQSAETGIAEARMLMRTDRFEEVLAVLRPLARGRTVQADVVFLIGLPFRRDVDDRTTSGVGVSVWTGGEYQHRLDDRLRRRIGGGLSRRDYAEGEFDQRGECVYAISVPGGNIPAIQLRPARTPR